MNFCRVQLYAIWAYLTAAQIKIVPPNEVIGERKTHFDLKFAIHKSKVSFGGSLLIWFQIRMGAYHKFRIVFHSISSDGSECDRLNGPIERMRVSA